MKTNFFSKINYSACNEDSNSELRALELEKNDTVLCVTASGARSFDLLLGNPKKIISIDFNPSQNHLLELKISAYKNLGYEDFLNFIGIEEANNRLEIFKFLKKDLSKEALIFWKKNLKLIKNGIIYSGTWEKILLNNSRLAFFRKKLIKQLFKSNTIEEQKIIWNKKWKNKIWNIFLSILFNRFLWEKIIKEPGFKLIDKKFDIKKYIQDRLDFLVFNFLLKENDFANLIFLGKYKTALPIHIKKENFLKIKNNIWKIEIQTISLLDFVSDKEKMKNITAMSLSDFGSYADTKTYKKIWEEIIKNSKNNTKFCERQFLIKRNIEKEFFLIKRNYKLDKKLNNLDLTVFYTFFTGKIIK